MRSALARFLEAGEEGLEVLPQFGREIAAFLHQQSRQAFARDPGGDLAKAGGRYRQARQRIAFEGIEAQSYHQGARRIGTNHRKSLLQRLQEKLVAAADGEGDVQVVALSFPLAALMGMAPEEGIEVFGIGVDRDGQDIPPAPEYALSAISVMKVDIENGDPLVGAAQLLGCNRGVVEKAEASRHVRIGVMPRWPAECIGLALTLQQQSRTVGGDVSRAAGGLPGVFPQGTSRVGHVPAGTTNEMTGVACGLLGWVNVGDDLGAAVTQSLPLRPGGLEEAEVVRAVHGSARPRPEAFGCQDLVALALRGFEQALRSFGLLGTGFGYAPDQEEGRVVTRVAGVVDDFHSLSLFCLYRCSALAASERRARKSVRTSSHAAMTW